MMNICQQCGQGQSMSMRDLDNQKVDNRKGDDPFYETFYYRCIWREKKRHLIY